jgi:hypothetical protein
MKKDEDIKKKVKDEEMEFKKERKKVIGESSFPGLTLKTVLN